MDARPSHPYYADPNGKIPQAVPAPYMVPPPYVGQHTMTWMPHYINNTPVLVPVYTTVPHMQNTSYYPQQVVYGNGVAQESEVFGPQILPPREYSHCEPNPVPPQQIKVPPLGVVSHVPSTNTLMQGCVQSTVETGLRRKMVDMKLEEQENACNYLSSKREILRYESADSGIAESPPSVSSSVTWSGDEFSLDDSDSLDSRSGRRHSAAVSDVFSESNEENQEDDENYWTVQDDKAYWSKQGQSPPNYYICSSIAKQVDYYLSDDYLVKDKYLLRQIRCKKDGYVSIKLITSFKKVKKLTRDWQVVRSAIARNSKSIVVSAEGLRIRRRTKLSENLRKPRLLTSVLVIRLPQAYNSVERVTSLFRNFGEISFVRLLRADKEVPADLRNYATQVHDIGLSLCGVVDFESADDALNAVRVIKHFQKQFDDEDDRKSLEEGGDNEQDTISNLTKYKDMIKELPPLDDLRLALLGPRVRRTLYRQDRIAEQTETIEQNVQSDSHQSHRAVTPDLQPRQRRVSADTTTTPINLNMGNRLQRSCDANTIECSRSVPKDLGSSRTWFANRRGAAFCSSQSKQPPKLSSVIRQPKGPDSSKGFKISRKCT